MCRQRKLSLHQRDTLAPKSRESPHHKVLEQEVLMGVWRDTGSARLQNLAVRSVFVLNSTPSGNKFYEHT
eukprot:38668-Pelagomonas_calceolata.AAC.1